jgi:hypothetical protein
VSKANCADPEYGDDQPSSEHSLAPQSAASPNDEEQHDGVEKKEGSEQRKENEHPVEGVAGTSGSSFLPGPNP